MIPWREAHNSSFLIFLLQPLDDGDICDEGGHLDITYMGEEIKDDKDAEYKTNIPRPKDVIGL